MQSSRRPVVVRGKGRMPICICLSSPTPLSLSLICPLWLPFPLPPYILHLHSATIPSPLFTRVLWPEWKREGEGEGHPFSTDLQESTCTRRSAVSVTCSIIKSRRGHQHTPPLPPWPPLWTPPHPIHLHLHHWRLAALPLSPPPYPYPCTSCPIPWDPYKTGRTSATHCLYARSLALAHMKRLCRPTARSAPAWRSGI